MARQVAIKNYQRHEFTNFIRIKFVNSWLILLQKKTNIELSTE